MREFEGRTIFLTGANGAIGRAVAQSFHNSGANVFLTDLDTAGLGAVSGNIGSGGRVHTAQVDVTRPAEIEEAITECVSLFNGIDFVVPMAGVYPEIAFAAMSTNDWRKAIDINLTGVFLTCRSAVRHLAENSSIVLVSSIAAHRGSALHSHYAAAKGGVLSLARSLAIELAPRTRVNAISPGIIETEMTKDLIASRGAQIVSQTPLGRLGKPDEVAGVVRFLCSDAASFITGETIHVNGGLYVD